jgi:hypothetical protein
MENLKLLAWYPHNTHTCPLKLLAWYKFFHKTWWVYARFVCYEGIKLGVWANMYVCYGGIKLGVWADMYVCYGGIKLGVWADMYVCYGGIKLMSAQTPSLIPP